MLERFSATAPGPDLPEARSVEAGIEGARSCKETGRDRYLSQFLQFVHESPPTLYADKLRASHVAVDLEIYRGVTHEFIKMGWAAREPRQAHADAAARAIARALEAPDP